MGEDGAVDGPLQHFCDTTSCAGPGLIYAATTRGWRILWWLTFIAAVGMTVEQTVELVLDFLEYEVAVEIAVGFRPRPFPALSLCRLDPFPRARLLAQPATARLLAAYHHRLRALSRPHAGPFNATDAAAAKALGLDKASDPESLRVRARALLSLTVAGLGEAEQRRLSPPPAAFVRACSFSGRDCDRLEDFREWLDPQLGHCLSFHSNRSIYKYRTSRAGPLYGMSFVLLGNASQDSGLSYGGGFRVLVHNQSIAAFPQSLGFLLPFGAAASVSLSFKRIVRLPSPHGDCAVSLPVPDGYAYSGFYSQQGCRQQCFQRSVQKHCACSDPGIPTLQTALPNCTVGEVAGRECWLRWKLGEGAGEKEEEEDAAKKAKTSKRARRDGDGVSADGEEKVEEGVECSCPAECDEGTMETKASEAVWPATLQTIVGSCEEGSYPNASCAQVYRNNGAFLQVFYEQINYSLLAERADMEFVNLLADFGGHIGLWLGLTGISFVEFIILAVQLGPLGCRKLFGKQPPKLDDPDEGEDEGDEDDEKRSPIDAPSEIEPPKHLSPHTLAIPVQRSQSHNLPIVQL